MQDKVEIHIGCGKGRSLVLLQLKKWRSVSMGPWMIHEWREENPKNERLKVVGGPDVRKEARL